MTEYNYKCDECKETKNWKKFVVFEGQAIRPDGKRICKQCFYDAKRKEQPLHYGQPHKKPQATMDDILAWLEKKAK